MNGRGVGDDCCCCCCGSTYTPAISKTVSSDFANASHAQAEKCSSLNWKFEEVSSVCSQWLSTYKLSGIVMGFEEELRQGLMSAQCNGKFLVHHVISSKIFIWRAERKMLAIKCKQGIWMNEYTYSWMESALQLNERMYIDICAGGRLHVCVRTYLTYYITLHLRMKRTNSFYTSYSVPVVVGK